MRRCVSMASILLAATPALAATISVRPGTPDRPNVVMVEGPLVAVDEDQFAAKSAPLSSAFVALSSDGGSLVAGLRIGEAIRRKGFSTIVPDGRRCASACALAWLGGVERFIGTDARIGFHAAYDPASDRETGVGNAVVGAYLTKIGLPYEAVIYITQTDPNEMTWLNMSDAAQRGIRVTLLSSHGLRFRETGFRGQRKMRRNDVPTVTMPSLRTNRRTDPRQFGAFRTPSGNLR